MRVLTYSVVSDQEIRYILSDDRFFYYCREIIPFWSILLGFKSSIHFKRDKSPSKGDSLLIDKVTIQNSTEIRCTDVSHRRILMHRANNNGKCVEVQSENCLIPLFKHPVPNIRPNGKYGRSGIVGESSLALVREAIDIYADKCVDIEPLNKIPYPDLDVHAASIRLGGRYESSN